LYETELAGIGPA